jgi:hypothetical protein
VSEENQSVFGPTRPPRATDVLFDHTNDFGTNACLAHWHDVERVYKKGYRRAALHLAVQVCDSQNEQDQLIYPIVYLYRHHTELVLKGIIYNAYALLGRKLDNKMLVHHVLFGLWKTARPLLSDVCDLAGHHHYPVEDLEGVESYIRQLDKQDRDGQRFRYATTNQGASHSTKLKVINVRMFAILMEGLADYLECIDSWFGDLRQDKVEMQHDAYG